MIKKMGWMPALFLAVVVAGTVGIFVIRSYKIVILSITSDSMQPSICSGDLIAVRMMPKELPALGQVIVHVGTEGDLLAKRVLGVSGDTMSFSINSVKRNGRVPSSLMHCSMPDENGQLDLEMTVPINSVFVVGDNVQISDDSRNYGAVPLSAVAGILVGHLRLSQCECNDIPFNIRSE